MKKSLLILLIVAVAAFAAWKFLFKKDKKPSGPPPVSMTVSKHSDVFNQSMMKMMDAYYGLTEAFVNWDTLAGPVHWFYSQDCSICSMDK